MGVSITVQYPGIKFRAMNTEIVAIGRSNDELAYWQSFVVKQFRSIEQSASRFLKDSELTKLNQTPSGKAFKVSRPFFSLLQDAWRIAIHTDFKFQPFIGTALVRSGYNRSFELLINADHTLKEDNESIELQSSEIPANAFDPHAISFDEHNLTICRNCPLQIDLGGIGKGWTVDLAARRMRDLFSVTSGIIDAGGDIQVWSDQDPWLIGIQNPVIENEELLQLWVRKAGIATSSIEYRKWMNRGKTYHHILDGHQFRNVPSDIVQATVIAPTTAEADAVAKVICTLRSDQVHEWMTAHFPSFAYIYVRNDGEIVMNRQIPIYVDKVV